MTGDKQETTQRFRTPHGGRIDRARLLRFPFAGATCPGHPGDTPASALLDPLPDLNDVSRNTYTLAKGELLPRDSLIPFLHESGYTREVMVEGVGQYAVRGAVLDSYPFGGSDCGAGGVFRGDH